MLITMLWQHDLVGSHLILTFNENGIDLYKEAAGAGKQYTEEIGQYVADKLKERR